MGESLVIAIGAGDPAKDRFVTEILKEETERALITATHAVICPNPAARWPMAISVIGPDGEYRWLAVPIARRVQPQPAAAQL